MSPHKSFGIATHTAREQGAYFEDQGLAFLTQQGLVLIARNYRTRYGEVDLIMREHATLVFVEIRYRRTQSFGSALESVTKQKQKKIIRTAMYYLQSTQSVHTACYRFDILAFNSNNHIDPIEWVPNAFTGF